MCRPLADDVERENVSEKLEDNNGGSCASRHAFDWEDGHPSALSKTSGEAAAYFI
jgi:hypothetical protein